jgi:peptidoglycan hydrolase-like protein with peptidoglycan-binding domain
MRKSAMVAVSALALPLAFSLPALAQQSAQPGNASHQARPHQPMQQSNNNGQNSNDQAAQLKPDQVKNLQQALNSKGFHVGRVDGKLGPRTRQALTRFQKSQKLQQSGQPDGRTLQALGVEMNGKSGGAATTGQAPNQPPSNSGNHNQMSTSPNSGAH